MGQYMPTRKLPFQRDKKFHIFLSFRGPDVRKTLVDHFCEALSKAGLNVFLDSDKLEKGEKIGLSLKKAIENSAIRIPIFSEGYADSVWCLTEAATIWNTPGLTIPLFYRVKPTDVRYTEKETGPYFKSFVKHYEHSDRPGRPQRIEIDEWKMALEQICSLSGWTTDETGGYEAQLVKRMVRDLIETFDIIPLEVADHPVGMDSKKNALIQKLNLDLVDEVVKVGVWGPGGIGKTTVVKALYNQIYLGFDAASFIPNVSTRAAETKGHRKLQKQILENLTNYKERVNSDDEGKSLLKLRLGGKRVLLILDDVDSVVQYKELVGDWLAPGSRVIITSRDKHIFNVASVSTIHEVTGLDINEGLQLFSWHAFGEASPSPHFEDVSKRIAEACKGHPHSLEVMGSSLCDKKENINCWFEALGDIRHNKHIYKRLYSSYSALSKEEKEIFVDIACFFNGEHKALPIIFWKSMFNGVDTAIIDLEMKSLIKIDHKGEFQTHDRLRDMGQTIAQKGKKGTRQWKATSLSTLSSNIKISRLRLGEGNPQRLERFYMRDLCYLHLQNLPIIDLTEDTLSMLPRGLIWLKLEHCPFTTGVNDAARQRRDSTLVDTICQLTILQIKDCPGLNSISLSSLFTLPRIQLQHLDLEGCGSLDSLPCTVGSLSELQHLSLRSCKNLISLPDTIGRLSRLQHLDLGECDRLSSLPDAITGLSDLQFLNLERCVSLESLPGTIGELSHLEHLDLRRCDRLKNLPNTIGSLSQLLHLDLEECINLNELPETIGNLSQLHLKLRGCRMLNSLLIPLAIYCNCHISF